MVTLVGTQPNFFSALADLLELEYDAIEAYTAAIDRLENPQYKESLREFRGDHEQHVKDITKILQKNNLKIKNGPSGKQILLVGNIAIGSLIGDKAILNAMLNAEEDMVTAYERMNKHADKTAESIAVMEKGLKDEQRHREWVKNSLAKEK